MLQSELNSSTFETHIPGKTASPNLPRHTGTAVAIAVAGLTRPVSERVQKGPRSCANCGLCTVSVDKGGMNLCIFRSHSIDTHS